MIKEKKTWFGRQRHGSEKSKLHFLNSEIVGAGLEAPENLFVHSTIRGRHDKILVVAPLQRSSKLSEADIYKTGFSRILNWEAVISELEIGVWIFSESWIHLWNNIIFDSCPPAL